MRKLARGVEPVPSGARAQPAHGARCWLNGAALPARSETCLDLLFSAACGRCTIAGTRLQRCRASRRLRHMLQTPVAVHRPAAAPGRSLASADAAWLRRRRSAPAAVAAHRSGGGDDLHFALGPAGSSAQTAGRGQRLRGKPGWRQRIRRRHAATMLLDRQPFFWVEHAAWLWMLLERTSPPMPGATRAPLRPPSARHAVPDALGLGLFSRRRYADRAGAGHTGHRRRC